ncbi:(+)-neomenthol dehydrogenase [Nymphaea colorata]|nr:(+)-neomenthol dehydrogenase [Nymphaea colorata]
MGEERYAVVTGANRGIGLAVVRRLASEGITVVLTARDESRGLEAVADLKSRGLTTVIFHQLDVTDPASVASLADFIRSQFGRLDILVNNAGASGIIADEEGLRALQIDPDCWLSGRAHKLVQGVLQYTPEKAEECLETNYYGCKRVSEALIPLLQNSTCARIVNVSSLRSELRRIPNEQIREEFGDLDSLTEEKLDSLVQRFLCDFKDDKLEANGWPNMLPAYSISKVALNAYTRVLAKKFPTMCINCVHPGFVKTELNWNTGVLTVEEGAEGPVMLALLPPNGPSGHYFHQMEMASF